MLPLLTSITRGSELFITPLKGACMKEACGTLEYSRFGDKFPKPDHTLKLSFPAFSIRLKALCFALRHLAAFYGN